MRLPVFLMELLDEAYHTEVNLCYDIALALFCLHFSAWLLQL